MATHGFNEKGKSGVLRGLGLVYGLSTVRLYNMTQQ